MSILELNQVSYSYEKKGNQVLSDISYSFEKGKLYAITGRSGAGKTALLSLICGLATPTSGSILLNGKDISSLNRYDYRSHDIGVIFQSFNLLPKLTARENVILSMDIAGYPCEDKKAHVDEVPEKSSAWTKGGRSPDLKAFRRAAESCDRKGTVVQSADSGGRRADRKPGSGYTE